MSSFSPWKPELSSQNSPEEMEYYREWIRRVADVCEEAAKGNLEMRLLNAPPGGGDLSRLVSSINHLLDITDAFVREAAACLAAAAEGRFYRRIILRGMPGCFEQSSKLANSASMAMEAQAKDLAELGQRRSAVASELKTVIASVANSAADVRLNADAIASGARITNQVSTEVAAAADQTSASVQNVASATEELTVTFSEVERRTIESEHLARTAVEDANRTSSTMRGLSSASSRIGGVIKLITEIAAQTKLLALNAAIEAARSGEAGKGFAVVAAEVKTLAQKTADATDEITSEVHQIQTSTKDVAAGMEQISTRIHQMSEISGAIALAISEQRHATSEISQSVHQAADNTRNVSRQMQDVRGTAASTEEQASCLADASNQLTKQSRTLDLALNNLLNVSQS